MAIFPQAKPQQNKKLEYCDMITIKKQKKKLNKLPF